MDTNRLKQKYKHTNIDSKNIDDVLKLHSFFSAANIELSEELLAVALRKIQIENPKTKNDFLYIATSSFLDINEGIKKTAYPGMSSVIPNKPFDMSFWTKLVYKIFDDISSGKKSPTDSLEYHASHLPEDGGEREKFKKWFMYYQTGENKKYANRKASMKKNAFQFPLMGSGLYQPSNGANAPSAFNDAKDKADKKTSDSTWKRKLDKALRSIDKLLRDADEHITAEEQDRLMDLYYDLNKSVRTIRFHSTAADVAHKTANEFRKLGFHKGADVLTKFSQEAPPVEQPVTPAEQVSPIEEAAPEQPASTQTAIVPNQQVSAEPFPDGVDLSMAIQKLEEVAGILSERRIIRTLAEFDIILDKMGVASMFPELSEAQSRLIDAFSYSLVRVSKMMGMLSSGKSINEISSAQNQKIQNQINKEINKTLNPEEPPVQVGGAQKQESAIQEEFQKAPAEPQPTVAPAPVK